MSAPRRFFIETWGCQMNELDSQRMAGQLMRDGLLPVREAAAADVILLNSCSIRDKAEQKVASRMGEYRLLKRDRPGLVLGLCGCVAQQEGERALSRVPDLGFVMGPARVGELPEVDSAVGVAFGVGQIDGDTVSPAVTDPSLLSTAFDLGVTSGTLEDLRPGEVAVSEDYATEHAR